MVTSFPVSCEDRTSNMGITRFMNLKGYACVYDADMEHNRNAWTRKLYRKSSNGEFHFNKVHVRGSDEAMFSAKSTGIMT